MKPKRCLLSVLTILLILPAVARAQLWSGVIDSKRAIDWTQAGIPGGLPDGAWTQCGSTIAAYSGTDATISNALAACAPNHYVLLGPGTFNISTQINFPSNTAGHVVLRGSGANSTFIVGATNGGATIRLSSNDGTYRGEDNASQNIKNWTAGYAQGATQITLSNVSGIVANQSMLLLSQCDTGFSGQYCLTGTPTDNNGYFICETPWTSTGVGCDIANESADGPSWRCQGTNCGAAWQEEQVLVTAINQGGCGATCVTISHPLHHPNWASGQYPVAIVIQGMPEVGVENLSIDGNNGGVNVGISTFNTYQAWVSGVRVVNMQSRGIDDGGSNTLIQNNYVFGNPINYNDDTGIHCNTCANEVVQNNIVQWPRIAYFADGPNPDSVIAYNYAVNAYSADDHLHGSGDHAGPGNDFNLWEGNVFTNLIDYDSDHGGHLNGTFFRNFMTGWESCANGNCGSFTAKDFNTHGPEWDYGSRYQNVVGNVWGTPGYHTIYSSNNRFDTQTIYEFGGAYGSQPVDPLVQSTSMLYGNWDVVTNATRWCGNSSNTGWATTCGSRSEVPTGAPTYPNSAPTKGDTGAGQGALPASFYLSSKPSWFGSIAWPVIGPDVSSGNVGQCAGTFNVAGKYNGMPATSSGQCAGSGFNAEWAGHVNAIPAMACYFSMGGVPDGTGSVLTFNPNACYGITTTSGSPSGPQPPTNLDAIVN